LPFNSIYASFAACQQELLFGNTILEKIKDIFEKRNKIIQFRKEYPNIYQN